MIAKITRGSRVGDIAAYLHGPGKSNEHRYRDTHGRLRSGGVVVASNIGAQGQADPALWAKDLRAAQKKRPEIKKAIWQASLRNTAEDRVLSDAEWAAAGQSFAERMGFGEHPWVMVRHAEDHVHIVVSRVNEEGTVWHGRNDRRQAQTVCAGLEREHGLTTAPRRKQRGTVKEPVGQIRSHHVQQARVLEEKRVETAAMVKRRRELSELNFPRGPFGPMPGAARSARREPEETYLERQRRAGPGKGRSDGLER